MLAIYIVIPAHNEALHIGKTLASLTTQTLVPKKIVVVNDHSTDQTENIVQSYSAHYPYISCINTHSTDEHLPGSKVINAFYQGFTTLDDQYDVICKFDADLIFPENYLAAIATAFNEHPKVGMAGGFCYIQKAEQWVLENLTNKDHIRGALKAYRKACFEDIQGLKPAMGWDTIDELLAQYHGWNIYTDSALQVKHLKPTGHTYNAKAKYKQGTAFYQMRYGVCITLIAAIKLALLKKQPRLCIDYMVGYWRAYKQQLPFLVTSAEGVFIRQLRWKKIRQKLC